MVGLGMEQARDLQLWSSCTTSSAARSFCPQREGLPSLPCSLSSPPSSRSLTFSEPKPLGSNVPGS